MARIAFMPPAGIYRSATPNAAAGRWYDCNYVRFRQGQIQPIGGNAALLNADCGAPPRDVLTWHDNAYQRWAAVGTDSQLLAYNFELGTLYDITPAGVGGLEPPGAYDGFGLGDYNTTAYGTARDAAQIGPADLSAILGDWWSLDLFGEDLLVVPTQDGRLFRWSPLTPQTRAAPVANAPENNRAVLVTDERAVVLLGAGGDPRAVAWSDQENPSSWTPAVDNTAGSLQLKTEGRPMRGIPVTGGVLIWTDNDVHWMRYVGPPYVYGINRIGRNCGLISPRAATTAGGMVFWMGGQSFWQYSGSVVPVPTAISDWMFSLINRSMIGRIFAAPNPTFSEHWWFWPGEGATECNRYVILNYSDTGMPMAIGQMARSAADASGALVRPIMGGQDGLLYMHEYGVLDNGVSRVGKCYIESADWQLMDNGGDPERRFHTRQVAHDYAGELGVIGYRFTLWEQPNGPEWDSGIYPVVNDNGLTDVRFSCRGMRIRVELLQDELFALGRPHLIGQPGGKR